MTVKLFRGRIYIVASEGTDRYSNFANNDCRLIFSMVLPNDKSPYVKKLKKT